MTIHRRVGLFLFFYFFCVWVSHAARYSHMILTPLGLVAFSLLFLLL